MIPNQTQPGLWAHKATPNKRLARGVPAAVVVDARTSTVEQQFTAAGPAPLPRPARDKVSEKDVPRELVSLPLSSRCSWMIVVLNE